jgi:hypothetical protein
MYYRIQTPEGLTPEVYRTPSSAHYDARKVWEGHEYSVVPYTLPERLESALSRLWRADANGAACAMTDLYDGYNQELLADEIERALANMEA